MLTVDHLFSPSFFRRFTRLLLVYYQGRLLRGKTVVLPEDVAGFVLRQDNLKVGGGAQQQAQNYASVTGTFKEMTYWNHDTAPSGRDYVPQAMRWFEVARKVHAPLPFETEENSEDAAAVPTPAAP